MTAVLAAAAFGAMAALRKPAPAMTAELAAALADELPLFKRDGGFVRAGYAPNLDEARALRASAAAHRRDHLPERAPRACRVPGNPARVELVTAAALHRTDVRPLVPGARADLVLLDAPSYVYLSLPSRVPLVGDVWRDGRRANN